MSASHPERGERLAVNGRMQGGRELARTSWGRDAGKGWLLSGSFVNRMTVGYSLSGLLAIPSGIRRSWIATLGTLKVIAHAPQRKALRAWTNL